MKAVGWLQLCTELKVNSGSGHVFPHLGILAEGVDLEYVVLMVEEHKKNAKWAEPLITVKASAGLLYASGSRTCHWPK